MNLRQRAAIAVVVLAALALAALRFFSGSPPTVTATTVATSSPTATEAALAVTAVPSTPPVTASAIVSTVPSVAPSSSEALASDSPSPTPSPSPSYTPSPNLLSATNGAFVRSWTVGGFQNNAQYRAQENGSIDVAPSFNRPVALLYELPAIAHIDRVGVALRGAKPARVEVAVGADVHHLRDMRTVPIALPADSGTERVLVIAADARFVRFTVTKETNDPLSIVAATAAGVPGAPERGALGTFERVLGEEAPEVDSAAFPQLRFEAHFAPLLAPSQLQRAGFAVLDGDCSASTDLSPRRQRLLLDWVGAGHKLIIRDADMCSSSDYTFCHFVSRRRRRGRWGHAVTCSP